MVDSEMDDSQKMWMSYCLYFEKLNCQLYMWSNTQNVQSWDACDVIVKQIDLKSHW